tara:strand:- start:2566 stop:3492 length:927 start_codon:yes stop_codon:yes gene_type:complete
MKILITGANGFIGTELVKYLLKNTEHQLTLITRKQNNLDSINKKYIYLDLMNNIDWKLILKDIDVVIHLAASQHKNNKFDRDIYRKINFEVTKKLSESIINSNVKKFIHLSTIKVIGEKNLISKKIDRFTSANPVGDYSLTKLEAEEAIIKNLNNTNVNYFIIRIPLVYGPNAKGNFKLLKLLLNNNLPNPLLCFNSKRSMLSIYNLIDFILHLLLSNKIKSNIYLLSDNDDVSLSELSKIIINNLKLEKAGININPKIILLMLFLIGKKELFYKMYDRFQIDINYTIKNTNWKPKYSVDESIKKTFY